MSNILIFLPSRPCAPMALCVVLGIGTASSADVFAMAPEPEPGAPASTKVLNGYGEQLRPSIRKKAGAPDQPYQPIKKQDDNGQIPEIDMFVGESRVFPAPNVGRIAVGNGQIMTAAALDRKEVIIFANAAGTSSLFVWNEDGRYQRIKVNIVAGDTSRVAREVAQFLGMIPHAKASIVGDKVIVDGDGLADADLLKIEQLEKRYPQIVNFTNKVGWEQMVFMDVKVVEFPRSELKEFGLKWGAVGGTTFGAIWSPVHAGRLPPGAQYEVNIPTGANGLPITGAAGSGAVLPSSLNLISGLNLGLNAQLNLLEQQGRASVLAEPQLSARNGAKASFLAGGEFPYSVSNNNGVTIIFKPYGIKLDITPKVDRNGVVRATVLSEVSSIDGSVSAIGGPALLTRRTETEFNVQAGETIVLSGLLQRSASTDIDKVPLLGDLPVLGALFRSKKFQNKETELVVFVTPSVVDSRSPGLVDRVKRATVRLEEQMGPQPFLSDPLQPGHPAADVNRIPPPPAVPLAPAQSLPPPSASLPEAYLQTEPPAPWQAASRPAAAPSTPAASTASAAPAAPAAPISQSAPANSAALAASTATPPVAFTVLPAPAAHATASAAETIATAQPQADGGSAPRTGKRSHARETQATAAERTVAAALPGGAAQLQVTSRMATLRAEPNRTADALLYLAKGATLVLDDRPAPPSNLWRPVSVGTVQGWILRSAVGEANRTPATAPDPAGTAAVVASQGQTDPQAGPGKAGESPAPPGAAAAARFRVVVDGLALRSSPDINATTITRLQAGSLVDGLPQPVKGLWTAVQAGSQRGWVATQWLTPDQPIAQR